MAPCCVQLCTPDSRGEKLECPSLRIKDHIPLFTEETSPQSVDIYVELDGVTLLRQHERLQNFQYFLDPEFFPFTDESKTELFDVSKVKLKLLVSVRACMLNLVSAPKFTTLLPHVLHWRRFIGARKFATECIYWLQSSYSARCLQTV